MDVVSITNDGEGLSILEDPLKRVIHPLRHANGNTRLVQQVPAWLDTPENVVRVMKAFLDLIGMNHDVV